MYQLFDEVTFIVKKPSDYADGYQQAFVFDSSNKSQKETAMKWAENEFDKEITIANHGFIIELYNAAMTSSQGGKVSFWDCLITLPDKSETYLIGINTDMLFDLLKQEDWKQGICQKKVFFAKDSGKLGLLTETMESYKIAVEDMKRREFIKKGKKTNKYEIGKNYLSLNEDFFYIGEVYSFASMDYKYGLIMKSEKEIKRKMIDRNIFFKFSGGSSNFTDFLNGWKSFLEYSDIEDSRYYSDLRKFYYFSYQGTFSEYEKFPKRTIGTEQIKFLENWKDELHEFEVFLRKKIEEKILHLLKSDKNNYLVRNLLEMYFISSFDYVPKLSIRLQDALKNAGYQL